MATYNFEDYLKRAATRIRAISADDEIVISGVSGKYPSADNVTELGEKLYNKEDMIDENELRWRHTNPEIPRRTGKINGLEKFDASFFGVHSRQANVMDPQCRLLLEKSYEAILDAGINPKSLKGTRTGVFVGTSLADADAMFLYDQVPMGGIALTGCARSMLANRISYTMGLKGPSNVLDTGCSTGLYVVDAAFNALRNGECDAAIVGAVNLLLHPYISLHFARLGVLSENGMCRPFDEDANGFTRAEAVCVMFLQRVQDAKRNYATVVYAKSNNDGFKTEGITHPSARGQAELTSQFYKDINMDPRDVHYVEAHATGTRVGDPQECESVDEIFCTGRNRPLPIGSVKSNMGHSEAAAGLCSLSKALITVHNNVIPPNRNFAKPRSDVPALAEGRLKVVTEPTPLDGPLIAVNAFGFGGSNASVLIRGNYKEKSNVEKDYLPRLIIWSGRTEDSCNTILDTVAKKPLDPDFVALLHNVQTETHPANIYRGFGVFANEDKKTKTVNREVKQNNEAKRPMVWVFGGVGCQWNTMGASLMKIPTFNTTIEKLYKVLKPKGLDLINILTTTDETIFDSILNLYVGNTAVQIAMVDVLQSLDIKPDYIIGHSVGEIACAYADGCLTAEQTILSAYCRGKASLEANVEPGLMAAIGMGYKDIQKLIPTSIEVACHNGPDSCTISGPVEAMNKLVQDLNTRGIFAKSVASSNIACHSSYIKGIGPHLEAHLKKIIKDPQPRSSIWLSTSVPKSKWTQPKNTVCSAEYQVNNLLSPVLFEETTSLLPKNSLLVEIASHGLLRAILRKSMPGAEYVGLAQKDSKENINIFLAGLGKLFLFGYDMPIAKLYPAVQFPVSSNTEMIAPLIRWDHTDDWFVPTFDTRKNGNNAEHIFKITLSDNDCKYLAGHTVDGRVVFPIAAYLQLVWETLGLMLDQYYENVKVEFMNLEFHRATFIPKDIEVVFSVVIHRGTGRFEITESSAPIVTGFVRALNECELTSSNQAMPSDVSVLNARDFYKELRLRGCQHSGEFKRVIEARGDGLGGKIAWNSNFVLFMDCMLQIAFLGIDTRQLLIVTSIDRIRINPQIQTELATLSSTFEFEYIKQLQIYKAGGVEVKGLKFSTVSRRKPQGNLILEHYQFLPHFPTPKLCLDDAARIICQFLEENVHEHRVKTIEIESGRPPIIQATHKALQGLMYVLAESILLTKNSFDLPGIQLKDETAANQTHCSIIIATNILSNKTLGLIDFRSLKECAYLVSREQADLDLSTIQAPTNTSLIAVIPTDFEETLLVFQYQKEKLSDTPTVIKVSSSDSEFEWIERINAAGMNDILIYTQGDSLSGILGLVNCIRKEPDRLNVRCVWIDDNSAPSFDIENPFYKKQLQLGLALNVYRNGQWGTYRHLTLNDNQPLQPENRKCFLNAMTKGDISSLKWLEAPKLDGELIRIQFASVNVHDTLCAAGKLSNDFLEGSRAMSPSVLGMEFSGMVESTGERVMGMTASSAHATHINTNHTVTWSIPERWSLEEAATIPVAYSMIYACLFLRTQIEKGKKILIHSGANAIGLAGIRVALSRGLEMFTTVANKEERNYLQSVYSQIKPSRIGNSQDLSFYDMIMNETNGHGVDYVINTLSDEQLLESIKCLKSGGHFFDLNGNRNDVSLSNKGITLHSISLEELLNNPNTCQMIHDILEQDIQSKTILPLKATVFAASHAEQAFKLVGSGTAIGKILLRLRDTVRSQQSLPIAVLPRTYFDPEQSYIIPGGIGGFGLELADWLVIRGCRKLVLSSSRGITNGYQKYRIELLKTYGAHVIVSRLNITTAEGCIALVQEAMKLGPVGGVFNLAVKLRDALLENQNVQMYRESLEVKATSTIHLDAATRKLCPTLKHFVIFSSFVCGRGNPGQTNYGMANSIMERVIESRIANGYPGKAIQWGPLGEVGVMADLQDSGIEVKFGDLLQQRMSSCFQVFDTLLAYPATIVCSTMFAEKRVIDENASDEEDAIQMIMEIMGLRDIKSVPMDMTLAELGMDSLMAVEIQQTLKRGFEISMTVNEVRTLTFGKLLAEQAVDEEQETNVCEEAKFTNGEINGYKNYDEDTEKLSIY